jgi:hypothetical protein
MTCPGLILNITFYKLKTSGFGSAQPAYRSLPEPGRREIWFTKLLNAINSNLYTKIYLFFKMFFSVKK